MSNFYEVFSKYYDEIFPTNEIKQNFILETADKNIKILDIGAGTGADAYAIQKKGYNITAMDLEESMVEIMKEKGLSAFTGNMLHLPEDQYGLIYCIGNTLAHLSSLKEIKHFLQEVYNKLEENGVFILQIINFKKFWSKSEDYLGSLPDVTTSNLTFVRKYFREKNKIKFHTEIYGLSENLSNDIYLYPILKDDLLNLLEQIGFSKIEIYSGFDKSNYDINKDPLVFRMRKE